MTTKISKKIANGLHAAVDELISENPEAALALSTIFEKLMQTETAVSVPAKKGKKAKAVADDDLDDDLDEEENDDDDLEENDDDLEEEENDDDDDLEEVEEEKPRRGRGRPAKADTKTAKGRKAKVEEEEEESSSEIDLDDLEADSIKEAFEGFESDETHEAVSGGVREMSAEIDGFGFDTAAILKKAKAKTLAEKKAAYAAFLSRIYFTIDAIKAFDLDSIIGAVEELGEVEDYKPAGRGAKQKEDNAARDCFRFAIFGADEE